MRRDPLVYSVIGHAMRVHREIGTGLEERFYHMLLGERLMAEGIEHTVKPRQILCHRGFTVDTFESDLLIKNRLILELKVLTGGFIREHFLQLKTYLKFWQVRQGLLMDFGKERLLMQSFLYDDPPVPKLDPGELARDAPSTMPRDLAHSLAQSFARIAGTQGFGYRDRTYRGLVVAELRAEAITCDPAPTAAVRVGDNYLGIAVLSRIVVAGQGAVLVLSQRQGISAADRSALRTALRLLELSWGAIVHFGRRDLELQWVSPGNSKS